MNTSENKSNLELLEKLFNKDLLTQNEKSRIQEFIETSYKESSNPIYKYFHSLWLNYKISKVNEKYILLRKEVEEKERIEKILRGEIVPILHEYNLEKDEVVYIKLFSERKMLVENITEITETKTKRKNVVGRAIVGGLILGPVGALGGAVTSSKDVETNIIQNKNKEVKTIDSGDLLLTNTRILFLGDNIISLPYEYVPQVDFPESNKMVIRYDGMAVGEFYEISGDNINDVQYYYKGIIKNIAKKD